MLDEVLADEKTLEHWVFDEKRAEVIFLVADDGKEAGFALFFHSFSTFLGRAGIYLEDLYVRHDYRGRGCGKAIMRKLAAVCDQDSLTSLPVIWSIVSSSIWSATRVWAISSSM